MVTISNSILCPLNVSDCVSISVDKVDRGPLDPPTILGVIMEVSINGKINKVGTKAGIIQMFLSRNILSKVAESLETSDVPKVSKSQLDLLFTKYLLLEDKDI